VRKLYFGYFRGKRSFFTVELQRQRVLLYLSLDPATVKSWSEEAVRDVTEIGHFGMGDVEYSIRSTENLHEARQLVKLAYEKSS
jgi:predicted transport protein